MRTISFKEFTRNEKIGFGLLFLFAALVSFAALYLTFKYPDETPHPWSKDQLTKLVDERVAERLKNQRLER